MILLNKIDSKKLY